MHCLEMIDDMNERAAAREAAHAWSDALYEQAKRIHETNKLTLKYLTRYFDARKEG